MLANYADFICQRFGEYSNMKFHTRPDISPLTAPLTNVHGRFWGGRRWPQLGRRLHGVPHKLIYTWNWPSQTTTKTAITTQKIKVFCCLSNNNDINSGETECPVPPTMGRNCKIAVGNWQRELGVLNGYVTMSLSTLKLIKVKIWKRASIKIYVQLINH